MKSSYSGYHESARKVTLGHFTTQRALQVFGVRVFTHSKTV